MRVLIIAALATVSTSFATDVYFVGGQSNAHDRFAAGVHAGLKDAGETDFVVVHAFHSGKSIAEWIGRKELYQEDFFSNDGAGKLQLALSEPDMHFEGLFWFQGESDRGAGSLKIWTNRFQAFLNTLRADVGAADWGYALAIIDSDPAFSTLEVLELTDLLRANMIAMVEGDPAGIGFDTRGFERRDMSHLTNEAAYDVGYQMAQAYVAFRAIPEPSVYALCTLALIVVFIARRTPRTFRG